MLHEQEIYIYSVRVCVEHLASLTLTVLLILTGLRYTSRLTYTTMVTYSARLTYTDRVTHIASVSYTGRVTHTFRLTYTRRLLNARLDYISNMTCINSPVSGSADAKVVFAV